MLSFHWIHLIMDEYLVNLLSKYFITSIGHYSKWSWTAFNSDMDIHSLLYEINTWVQTMWQIDNNLVQAKQAHNTKMVAIQFHVEEEPAINQTSFEHERAS